MYKYINDLERKTNIFGPTNGSLSQELLIMFVLLQTKLFMLHLSVHHQSEYSRLKLLLRLFFGPIYIGIPHAFLLFFVAIWGKLLWLYATFHILIKGTYPENAWDYMVGLLKWGARFHLSTYNMTDEYPAFGVKTEVDYLQFDLKYPEHPDRLKVLLRFIFLPIVLIPHVFVFAFRNIWNGILSFLAFFAILFTGKYPENWFTFNVGTLQWVLRVMAYGMYMFDEYPPFNGRVMNQSDEQE